MYQTLKANDIKDGYIRLVVSRGAGTLGLDPNRTSNPQVIVITDYISLYPDELYRNGLEIVTASTIRNHPGALSPRIKSLNYLNNILAKIESLQAGCMGRLTRSTGARPGRTVRSLAGCGKTPKPQLQRLPK